MTGAAGPAPRSPTDWCRDLHRPRSRRRPRRLAGRLRGGHGRLRLAGPEPGAGAGRRARAGPLPRAGRRRGLPAGADLARRRGGGGRRARPGHRRPPVRRGGDRRRRVPRRRRHPPDGLDPRVLRRERGRHPERPRPGPAQRCRPLRARVVQLAVRGQRLTRRGLHRGLALRPLPGLRPVQVRGRAAGAAGQRPGRRGHGHDPGPVVLRPLPAAPAEPVLPHHPPGAVPAGGRRHPAPVDGLHRNLVQGLLKAEVADKAPGNAYWVADARPYELREILATVRTALDAEAAHLRAGHGEAAPGRGPAGRAPRRAGPGPAATSSPCTCWASSTTRSPATSPGPGPSSATQPTVELLEGMRASIRWCVEHGEQL